MAVKFNFRFQNVLQIKEKIEEGKRHQLATTQKYLNKEEKRLDHLLQRKHKKIEVLHNINKENQVMQIRDMKNSATKLEMINELIKKQQDTVEKGKLLLKEHRYELVEAKKEKKTFEKIKEKDLEEFKIQENKNEAALIDQIVTYKSTITRGG